MIQQYVVYFQNSISGKRMAINKAVEQICALGATSNSVQPYLGSAFIEATDEQAEQIRHMNVVQKISPLH